MPCKAKWQYLLTLQVSRYCLLVLQSSIVLYISHPICFLYADYLLWFSSDEVRHLLGSETTRLGVMRVFNMFQHERLNKRLVYVIFEGMLETLFPDNKFDDVFRKIHSRSPRVKKNSATTTASVISDKSSQTKRRKK